MKRNVHTVVAATALTTATLITTTPFQKAEAADIPFIKQTQTVLELGNDTFDYVAGDINGDGKMDICCLKRIGTGSGNMEIHVLDGASDYQSFLLQTALPIEMGTHYKFALYDHNSDGYLDLYAFKINYTSSTFAEVHVLDGSKNFQNFLLQTRLPVERGTHFDYGVCDYDHNGSPDIVAIKKEYTGSSGRAEVHILNGSNNFQNFLLQTAIPIETGSHFSYIVGNFDGDNRPDIMALKKTGTGSGKTESHLLSGSSEYQNFIFQSALPLETGDNFIFSAYDWNRNGRHDLIAVKRRNTNKTEVHVLDFSGISSSNSKIRFPLQGTIRITSRSNKTNGFYCDYVASEGTPIYAPADGIAMFYQTHSASGLLASYGNNIQFQSSDGRYTIKMAHLSSFYGVQTYYTSSHTYPCSANKIKCFSKFCGYRQVHQGDLLGYVGKTGNASGPHLHLEVFVKNEKSENVPVNPASVLADW